MAARVIGPILGDARILFLKGASMTERKDVQTRWAQIAEALEAGIAGARTVILPGTAHLPNLEQPEAFNQAVLSFLQAL